MSKNTIKVLIVDDEKPAREELLHLLKQCPQVTVIGMARDCFETEEFLLNSRVDLIFMDIQMPGLNGMELARKILLSIPTIMFIFTTAYDKFAVDAFDIHAVDYLLKPLRFSKLQRAISRAENQIDEVLSNDSDQMRAMIDSYLLKKQEINKKFISVFHGEQIIPVKIDKILYAESRGRYVWIVTDNNEYKTNLNFKHMEDILEEPDFFVCHRSYIINLNRIESIELSVNSSYQIRLTGCKTLIPVSRNRKDRLQNLLSI